MAGIDWEDILDAEGDHLQDAYDETVEAEESLFCLTSLIISFIISSLHALRPDAGRLYAKKYCSLSHPAGKSGELPPPYSPAPFQGGAPDCR